MVIGFFIRLARGNIYYILILILSDIPSNKTEGSIAQTLMMPIFIVQRANTTKTGIILISFNFECGTAQLSLLLCVLYFCSSRYVAFVELIDLNDLLDDVTFPLSTNQKPRKNLHTHTQTTDDRRTDGQKSDL